MTEYHVMKTMCKTRGGRMLERDKIGKKRWTSDTKEKKDEIWYYSQVAKVRLWTEFGSFPSTHNK